MTKRRVKRRPPTPPVQAWAIKHWSCGFYADTVRRTRAETKEAFREQYGADADRWVNRAVRVVVGENAMGGKE
jgi:hypothetical protein